MRGLRGSRASHGGHFSSGHGPGPGSAAVWAPLPSQSNNQAPRNSSRSYHTAIRFYALQTPAADLPNLSVRPPRRMSPGPPTRCTHLPRYRWPQSPDPRTACPARVSPTAAAPPAPHNELVCSGQRPAHTHIHLPALGRHKVTDEEARRNQVAALDRRPRSAQGLGPPIPAAFALLPNSDFLGASCPSHSRHIHRVIRYTATVV